MATSINSKSKKLKTARGDGHDNHKMRLQAIGLTISSKNEYELTEERLYPEQGRNLPVYFCKSLIPDPSFFTVMKKPKKSDWLAEHKTIGQTFKRYVEGGAMNRPTIRRKVIYLLPLVFDEEPVPAEILQPLKLFASIFFGLKVKLMTTKNMKGKVADRMNDGVFQVHAEEVLQFMKDVVPADAFCVAGITLCDLYPRESWNFVFGLASDNCGVYSMARYLSNFGEHRITKYDPSRELGKETVLKRSCKTMVHEIGHMFGLGHCIYYSCVMNGSNHLNESDSRAIFLCPVCLRKLHFACKFDILQRYIDMEKFWSEQKLDHEINWLQRRVQFLSE